MSLLNSFWYTVAGGGGNPPPVTSGLILNLDANTVSVGDGVEIGTGDWEDSSSAANHPLNAAGSGKPVFRATGGPGGLPTVEFFGTTNSYFDLTNQIAPVDLTIFAVSKPTDSNPRTFLSGATGAFQYRVNSLKQDVLRAGVTLYGSSSTSLSTSAFQQTNVTFNQTSRAFAFRLSQTNDGSGTGGGSSPDSNILQVFRNEANVVTGEIFLGFCSHLLAYNRILSGGEITSVEGFLNTLWGV